MPETLTVGPVEFRLDDAGDVDEICVTGPDGSCAFHLEYLDDNRVWAAAYGPGGERRVVEFTARGRIRGRLAEPGA